MRYLSVCSGIEAATAAWRGRPESECPDGQRYRALGNSMAVPVMRFIGMRLAALDALLRGEA